ncbi:hypothetical protein [[Mycoplasma] testudinis]|uniref:hypothetical protein n=1 Tax=[Mycoplasma] testudinis TaxID=33924 RepID=UPI00048494A3|nr:hypothetical protein [[Mycoplasma] testudinis]
MAIETKVVETIQKTKDYASFGWVLIDATKSTSVSGSGHHVFSWKESEYFLQRDTSLENYLELVANEKMYFELKELEEKYQKRIEQLEASVEFQRFESSSLDRTKIAGYVFIGITILLYLCCVFSLFVLTLNIGFSDGQNNVGAIFLILGTVSAAIDISLWLAWVLGFVIGKISFSRDLTARKQKAKLEIATLQKDPTRKKILEKMENLKLQSLTLW